MVKNNILIFTLVTFFICIIFLFSNYSFKINSHKFLIIIYNKFTFKKQKYEEFQNKINQGYLSSKYGELKFSKIKLDEKNFNIPLGYIDQIRNDVIFFRTDGDLIVFNQNLNKQNIRNNILNYFNKELDEKFYKKEEYANDPFIINPIRDILYHNGFLYVVMFSKKLIDDKLGYTTIVLRGKFNFDYVNFEYFFNPNSYAFGEIDTWHTGGRLIVNNKNEFFLAIPDYGKINLINDKKNIFGKVLKIKSNNNFEIISQGHRNPQGLYYDSDKDILLESEHGPSAGDEINIIKKDRNYGWPSTSVGIHENFVEFHDHNKKGFEKPAYAWTPFSSGVSQIIKIDYSSKFKFKDHYIVSTLGGKSYYYGNHLYIFKIKDSRAIIKDKIYIGDRVRDIHYDKFNDRIYLSLENEESLGIIDLN